MQVESFVDLNQFPDDALLERGVYEATINSSILDTSKNGSEFLAVDFTLFDPATNRPVPISDRLWMPHAGQKDGGRFCGIRLKKFLAAFGIQHNGKTFDVPMNATGKLLIVKRIPKADDTYHLEPYNEIASYIAPNG